MAENQQAALVAGDRVVAWLGPSRVYGTFVRYDHGGLSAFVAVQGHEEHHTWFALPPWQITADEAGEQRG